MPIGRIACFLLVIAAVPACHRGHARSAATPSTAVGANHTRPIGRALGGSTVALARVEGKRIAFISDADTHAVRRVDVDDRIELEPIAITSTPGPLLVLDDGRILVLAKEEAKLVVMGGFTGPDDNVGTDRIWATVPPDPAGLALSPDGKAAYVTSGIGHTLVGFRTKDFERTFATDLAREPRSIVVSDDGSRVFVSHAVGSHLSIVDVSKGEPTTTHVPLRGEDAVSSVDPNGDERDFAPGARQELVRQLRARARRSKEGLPTCQGFALAKSSAIPNRLFAPEVLVDPGLVEIKSNGYGSDFSSDSELSVVGVIDAASGTPVPVSMKRVSTPPPREKDEDGVERSSQCLLPRAAAIDDRSRTLLVACQGIDALVAYDALSASPGRAELRRWHVGAGPTGVAIDVEAREAVVWSQFDRTLSVVRLDEGSKTTAHPAARIVVGPSGQPSALALGRMLFHRTGDARISRDGRACASCHPDGRDDGLVWSTPDGPRRSIMLAGRLVDTAPFSWQGNASTVQKHLASTLTRLGGSGLELAEVDALVAYVQSLRIAGASTETREDPRVHAGAKVFSSRQAGCSVCHSGASLTDGAMHDVGSGRTFNTPSLLGVGSTGPWFHDGRYASLSELLRKSDGRMGHTHHLKPEEFASLEAFLRSL